MHLVAHVPELSMHVLAQQVPSDVLLREGHGLLCHQVLPFCALVCGDPGSAAGTPVVVLHTVAGVPCTCCCFCHWHNRHSADHTA